MVLSCAGRARAAATRAEAATGGCWRRPPLHVTTMERGAPPPGLSAARPAASPENALSALANTAISESETGSVERDERRVAERAPGEDTALCPCPVERAAGGSS